MAAPTASPRPPARRPDRGAALLVVIVATAILTALAVDLAYASRVSLLTAGNARDELRAEYAARSGVQLGRLVLAFQNRLDLAAPPGAQAVRLQVWALAPVTSALTAGLFGAAPERSGPGADFEARIEDEGTKVNLQLDGETSGGLLGAQVAALLELVADPRWDPYFERETPSGLKVTRTDLAVHLHDWTDDNAVGSAIGTNPLAPFADGFGDENAPYSRGEDRYEAKNARFDSVAEALLVAGFDDDLMDAFGDRLTVYPHRAGRINVNTLDTAELVRNARAMADPPDQAALLSADFPERYAKAVALARQGGLFSLRPSAYAGILRELGVVVRSIYTQPGSDLNGAFTDRSLVFRIVGTGRAGATERRLRAVVTFDTRQTDNVPVESGRLLHWREE